MWWISIRNNNFKKTRCTILITLILYLEVYYCFPIERKIIFHRLSSTYNANEHNNFAAISDSNFNTKEDHYRDDSETSFCFLYSKDFIKLTIFDIKKFPLNFKGAKGNKEIPNDDNLDNIHIVEECTIRMFELFLFSHYLPPKNLSVKDFLNFLHLFEAMNIEFDQKLARIIHVLSITLLNSKNMYSFGFKEELVGIFLINLLSQKYSFFVFETLAEVFFIDMNLEYFCQKSHFGNYNLPKCILERFENIDCNCLYIGEYSFFAHLYQTRSKIIQNNMISLNLNFELQNKTVIFNFGSSNNSLIIKYIFIFELKLYDDIEFIPIDLVNLKNLIIFERESKVIDTLMSAEFTEILKFATEKEIDISGLSTTENLQEDRKKEYKVN
ncbi:hypothetical protein CWI38_0026p0060 [Hamiltosporidium tvaerminnensis]|uniref:Uncharacterized protein n=1 Tax=Hamiltosporidium tvaerminnensis TaxID=1176355 RepID=A0A4Q9M5B2_9MICR|nr:hypothetical protein CWI38_0026p0060 [Hamiltosporidium tvaerminnensis]